MRTTGLDIASSRKGFQLDDPFEGFFRKKLERHNEWGTPGGGRRIPDWLERIDFASRNDFYTYQQALETKTGPRVRIHGQDVYMISSYDYLGLTGHPAIEDYAKRCIDLHGTSTGGVRLLTGTATVHRSFEQQLAQFLGVDATVTFSSGYLANLAVFRALFDQNDVIFVDQKIHQSIIEACKLAQVPYYKFKHNDCLSLHALLDECPTKGRKLIVSEGIFSMDGDICSLPDLLDLKAKHNAYLMIDESHALGVLGEHGRGVCEYYGIDPREVDIFTASLSKAIPSNGGYIAGTRALVYYLQHEASPFIFSAATSPAAVGAASAALSVINSENGRIKRLWKNTRELIEGFRRSGWTVMSDQSPIIPIFVGREADAYRLTRVLFDYRVAALAVVYPAVSRNRARLRICATAAMDGQMIDDVLRVFFEIRPQFQYI